MRTHRTLPIRSSLPSSSIVLGFAALAVTQCATARPATAATTRADLVVVEVTEVQTKQVARIAVSAPVGNDSVAVDTASPAASYELRARWRTASESAQPPCLAVDMKRKDSAFGNFTLSACVPARSGERTILGRVHHADGRDTEIALLRGDER